MGKWSCLSDRESLAGFSSPIVLKFPGSKKHKPNARLACWDLHGLSRKSHELNRSVLFERQKFKSLRAHNPPCWNRFAGETGLPCGVADGSMFATRKGSCKPACQWCSPRTRLRAWLCDRRPIHWWHRIFGADEPVHEIVALREGVRECGVSSWIKVVKVENLLFLF